MNLALVEVPMFDHSGTRIIGKTGLLLRCRDGRKMK